MMKLLSLYAFLLALTQAGCLAPDDDDTDDVSSADTQASCSAAPTDGHCTGRDPVNQGCDDAFAVATSTIIAPPGYFDGQAALRYSPKCKSVWARTTGVTPASRNKSALISARGYSYETLDTQNLKINSKMIYIGNHGYASYEGCGYWLGSEGGLGWSCGDGFDIPVP